MTVFRYVFVIAAMALSALAAEPAAAAVTQVSAPPNVGASVFRMMGGLCIVISLLMAGAWAFRNRQRLLGVSARNSKLRVLESRSLGARHSICVVAYEQQRILLSTSPSGVSMLTHLPEASLDDVGEEAKAPAFPSFSEAFMQALASRRK